MPDDLLLSGFDTQKIQDAKDLKVAMKVKPPNEIAVKREERLTAKESRMAAKGGGVPTSAPPPPEAAGPTAEDRSHLLDQLQAYREKFPALKERNKVNGKSTFEEIEDEIHYIKYQLGSRRDGNMGFVMFTGAMAGLELTTEQYFNPMGLKLTGVGQVAKDNYGEVEAVIDELLIKYGTGFYMAPETRLVLAVGAMVATVHLANTGDPKLAQTLQAMNQRIVPPKSANDL